MNRAVLSPVEPPPGVIAAPPSRRGRLRLKHQSPWNWKKAATEQPLPDDFIARLFSPETITPAQQGERYERAHGERKLLLAILADAVKIYLGWRPMVNGQQDRGRVERTILEAREWIESYSSATGSFVWVCELLRLEPVWLREMLWDERVERVG